MVTTQERRNQVLGRSTAPAVKCKDAIYRVSYYKISFRYVVAWATDPVAPTASRFVVIFCRDVVCYVSIIIKIFAFVDTASASNCIDPFRMTYQLSILLVLS
jgi:hypothetical protein